MLLTLLFAAAIAGTTRPPTLVSSSRVGPVTVGMSVKQAESALGTRLSLDPLPDHGFNCRHASRADGGDPGIAYMVLRGTIQRIEVALRDEPGARTAEGIGAGSTRDAVRRAYGARIESREMDPNGDPDEPDMILADSRRGIRFMFENKRVMQLIIGNFPAVAMGEGCN